MTGSAHIDALLLDAFKSFRDAELPLSNLTLVVGRNGSGKSNTIDALHVLTRLAQGDDLRQAIDGGGRSGQEVRGGLAGCAPYGDDEFALGCRVARGGELFTYRVRVQVSPDIRIVGESLVRESVDPAVAGGRGGVTDAASSGEPRTLLATDPPDLALSDINARYYNGKRGPDPSVPFRSDRLLLTQVGSRVPQTTKATREVHAAVDAVLAALRDVFILDPVPALMRQYVPRRDTKLRRQGDNLSAVLGALAEDPVRWEHLKAATNDLAEQDISDIAIESSQLDDVMIALRERFEGVERSFPARVMSDGMLRFLAFAAALLEPPLQSEPDPDGADTLLVIEEIENGLHPSQAASVVEFMKDESTRRRVRAFATTHSPAILSVLDADDHRGVVVCRRDRSSGRSMLVGLTELDAYPDAMAAGSLGDALTQRRLERVDDVTARRQALDALLADL